MKYLDSRIDKLQLYRILKVINFYFSVSVDMPLTAAIINSRFIYLFRYSEMFGTQTRNADKYTIQI